MILIKLNKRIHFIVLVLILSLISVLLFSCIRDSAETTVTVEKVTIEEEEDGTVEEETIEVEEELSVEKKLDELQQRYSLEFRQHLETLDDSYLKSLLADDNLVKQEYDVYWRNTFYDENIIFTADGNIFPSSWYGSGIDAKAESLAVDEIERSKRIIITALDKYPTQLLRDNLKKVYVLKSMNFYGVYYGGTNLPPDIVYVANDGVNMGYTDIAIEKGFHHEFSSVLFNNYRYLFDETGWRQVNPAGFVYFDETTGGAGAIKEGKASQVFDSKEHEIGFLHEYAQSTLENDFNSFTENIFMGEEDFFRTVEQYDKLKMKLDLIIAFYNAIHTQFTLEYFKNL